MSNNRRSFLKGLGLGAIGAAASLVPSKLLASDEELKQPEFNEKEWEKTYQEWQNPIDFKGFNVTESIEKHEKLRNRSNHTISFGDINIFSSKYWDHIPFIEKTFNDVYGTGGDFHAECKALADKHRLKRINIGEYPKPNKISTHNYFMTLAYNDGTRDIYRCETDYEFDIQRWMKTPLEAKYERM